MSNVKCQKGQVALIVLLISAIVLSLGLSMSRKTTVETKVDTDEELLKQAFNTAESAIDKYLVTGETTYSGGVGASATVESRAVGNEATVTSELLTEGKAAFFWLAVHNPDGSIGVGSPAETITVCAQNSSFAGAFKIENFYSGGGTYRVVRTGSNIDSNDFVNGFTNVSGKCFEVTTQAGSLLLTVTPIFDPGSGQTSTVITAGKSANFVAQGEDLMATGRVGDQTTGVSRKVRVRRGYKVPAFMLDALTTLQ